MDQPISVENFELTESPKGQLLSFDSSLCPGSSQAFASCGRPARARADGADFLLLTPGGAPALRFPGAAQGAPHWPASGSACFCCCFDAGSPSAAKLAWDASGP